MNWKRYKRWPWNTPLSLRVADRLGKTRGRMRVLDKIAPPPPAPRRPDLSKWHDSPLAAVWLGHATMLLRIDGKTVLTDPVLMNRVGLGLGLMTGGPRRLVAPALAIKELPPIDIILISHAHFDHLDRATLSRLPKSSTVITSEHNSDLVGDLGFKRVIDVAWGKSATVDGLKLTACQVKHWGARTVLDGHRGYAGFLIDSGRHRILYGGDTAYHHGFRDLGKVDLAIVGIGAYDPWIESHATPEQAWAMSRHVDATHVAPMHHSTFTLSHEPRFEPIKRILLAAGPDEHRIVIRQIGDQWRAEE